MTVDRFILVVLPYILSAIAIYTQFQAGNKKKSSWLITLASQGVWLIWICYSKTWGFIPLNLCMSIMAIRNYIKWWKEEDHNDTYTLYDDVLD